MDQKKTSSSQKKINPENPEKRKAYTHPQLTKYGDLKELTASTGAIDTDGLSPRASI